MSEEMVTRISWDVFRETGLLLFVNSFLHIFGLAIVAELDDDGCVTNVYPARTRFRGFSFECVDEAHKKLAAYIEHNAQHFCKD